ncbi:unnamed protein product [Rodentolepis nana]|uniref:protein-tyrosine-phosphatase n=1 Tax=Rodentolepis nana TaxID=102285 RepID=A0A0R3T2B2_RODNA|nr:unnamed protein product [Rodentolepis nana]
MKSFFFIKIFAPRGSLGHSVPFVAIVWTIIVIALLIVLVVSRDLAVPVILVSPNVKQCLVRAKLLNPPQLDAECSTMFVSWRPFNLSVDIGNADIREYRVELLLSSGEVVENKTVLIGKLIDNIYREVFTNVEPGESYRAQVTPIFFVGPFSDDGYLEEGLPSPLSEAVYVSKEGELRFIFFSQLGCHSNIVPFVPTDNSTIQTITLTNCPNILEFNNTVPSGGRLNGPRDCSLIGLSTNWAIFQWHHNSISCGLGNLVGYELSLAVLGQDTGPSNDQVSSPLSSEEVTVKRYRTDAFSTFLITQDLLPGTRYRAQVFAIYERGTVACSGMKMGDMESNTRIIGGLGHFEFTTFTELEAQSSPKVKISVLEQSSDRFGVRVQIGGAAISESVQLWTTTVACGSVLELIIDKGRPRIVAPFRGFKASAFPIETRLPKPIDLDGKGSSIQSASGEIGQFTFASNILPATRYRIYGWAVSASEQRFLGVTSDVWTSPKHFLAYHNFELPPPQILEVLAETIVARFPNISGYEGGPVTDYFIAIAPGNFSVLPSPTSLSDSSFIHQRLSLPSTSRIVFHGKSIPRHHITIGDGAVEVEMNLPDSPVAQIYADPRLEPDSNYTLITVVVSSLEEDAIFKPGTEHLFVVSPAKARIVRTLVFMPASGVLSTSVGTGVSIGILLLCFIVLVIYIWWRFLRYPIPFCKKSKQYSLNMRPSRRMSCGSALTTIEDFMTALPKSYPAWSFPLNLRDPRFLVIDPQRGPDSNLLGSKGIHDIAETFFREYKSFSVNKLLSQTHAKQAVNREKNRCPNSLPFDHNRVQLHRRGQFQTDYINASFVDGYMRRKAYICAQSPFNASTASDFWAMIDQCGVSQIITLDNLIESGLVKCTKFWPDKNGSEVTGGYGDALSGSERRQYDTLIVEADEVQEYANFTIRRFRLTDTTNGGENRITQFHYHRWRCQDVDDSDSDYAYGRDENDLVNNFDLLAFLDFYIHQLMHERSVTVGRTCASLRRARQNAIPTARHYALLYDLLFEVGIAGHSILDLDIRSTFASLNQRNVIAGFTYLKEQWYLLHNYSLLMSPRAFASPASVSITGEDDHFIDKELSAVWVDGLTVRKDLLLVCAPRTNSALAAFWQFVFKQKVILCGIFNDYPNRPIL